MRSSTWGAVVFPFALFLIATVAYGQPTQPLPLDPLSAEEREAATSLARADARVRELLGGGRTRQIYTDFIAVKRARTPAEEPSGRYADVLFYRYDRDLGVRALVDLVARTVVDVVRVNGQSVPINNEEVEEAARLALADPRVPRLFGGAMPSFRVATRPATREDINTPRIEALRVLGTSADDPCYRHRCIVLFFRVDNRYVNINRVVVDMTTQTVQIRGGGQ